MNILKITRLVMRRARELFGPPTNLTDAEIAQKLKPEIGTMNGATDAVIDEWLERKVADALRRARGQIAGDDPQMSLLPEYPGVTPDHVVRVLDATSGKTVTIPTPHALLSQLGADVSKREAQIVADRRAVRYNKTLHRDLSMRVEQARNHRRSDRVRSAGASDIVRLRDRHVRRWPTA